MRFRHRTVAPYPAELGRSGQVSRQSDESTQAGRHRSDRRQARVVRRERAYESVPAVEGSLLSGHPGSVGFLQSDRDAGRAFLAANAVTDGFAAVLSGRRLQTPALTPIATRNSVLAAGMASPVYIRNTSGCTPTFHHPDT